MTANEIAEEMGINGRTSRFLITRLVRDGKLIRKGTGHRIIYNKP